MSHYYFRDYKSPCIAFSDKHFGISLPHRRGVADVQVSHHRPVAWHPGPGLCAEPGPSESCLGKSLICEKCGVPETNVV